MRVLIVSKEGDGAGIAYKLTCEGHYVDLWIEDSHYKDCLKGYVHRPDSWRPVVAKADLVLCDMVGYSKYADIFRRLGKPVLCCNPVGDVLELNRQKGMEAFHKLGINTPPSQSFNSIQEAEKLEWKNETGYVLKADGNLDCGKTYLCETEEIYKWALSTLKDANKILVQELIPKEDSVEVSTEGWFNGIDFVEPFNHTFEEKHHMPGGIGKMHGCSGNIVIPVLKPTPLVKATTMRFALILSKAGYRGPVDVNCIVTKDKVYALELTCRFGFDAFEALMTGLTESVGGFLFDVATGIKKQMSLSRNASGYDYLSAVRVHRDPYPMCKPDEIKEPDKGMPICGLNEQDMKFVYLCDVYRNKEDEQIKYAASDGVVLKATSFGRSVKEAQHRVYKLCKNIKAIDVAYANDIGNRVDKDIERLKEWGWL